MSNRQLGVASALLVVGQVLALFFVAWARGARASEIELELARNEALEAAVLHAPRNVPTGRTSEALSPPAAGDELAHREPLTEGSPYSIGCEFEDEVPGAFRPDRERFEFWIRRWWENGVEILLDAGEAPPTAEPDVAAVWESGAVEELWELTQGLGFLAYQLERYEMRERMRLDATGAGVNVEDEFARVGDFLERAGVGGLEFDEAATALSLRVARELADRDPIPQNLDEDTRLLEYARTAPPIGSTPEERFLVQSIRRAQARALLRIGDELDLTTPGSSSRRALETHLSED